MLSARDLETTAMPDAHMHRPPPGGARPCQADASRLAGLALALRVGLAYLAIGAAWVLLSDRWLWSASHDLHALQLGERAKGLVFVGLSGAALSAWVYRSATRLLDLRRADALAALAQQAALEAGQRQRLEDLVAQRTASLAEANQALDAFTRSAAHDLKSPLHGIAGLAQLLVLRHCPQLGPDARRLVEQIDRSARQMGTLVDDLLAHARAGSAAADGRWVDLAPLMHSVVEDLRRAEPERAVELVLPAAAPAFCDAGLMRSVLQNLLGNAWKFSADGAPARITVAVAPVDGPEAGTWLSVHDNGCGFEAKGVLDSFQPFQRFHTPRRVPGSGLGLATCQRIVQRHGGQLRLASVPGQGTTASLFLPGLGASGPDASPSSLVRQTKGAADALAATHATHATDTVGAGAVAVATGTRVAARAAPPDQAGSAPKRPRRRSSIACTISAGLFITNGPCPTTGSSIGSPASNNSLASAPPSTSTCSA